MRSNLKMVHLASVNDTFKVVRFFENGVLKCRYLDAIQMAGTHIEINHNLFNEINKM